MVRCKVLLKIRTGIFQQSLFLGFCIVQIQVLTSVSLSDTVYHASNWVQRPWSRICETAKKRSIFYFHLAVYMKCFGINNSIIWSANKLAPLSLHLKITLFPKINLPPLLDRPSSIDFGPQQMLILHCSGQKLFLH